MKAAVIHEFGNADVFKYEEVPTPKPKAGNVLAAWVSSGPIWYRSYRRLNPTRSIHSAMPRWSARSRSRFNGSYQRYVRTS